MQEGAPAAPHKLHFKNRTASPKGEVGCSQQSLSLPPLPWGVFIVFSSQLRTINTPVCYLDQNCFPLHLSGPCSCLNSAVSSLLQVTYHIFLPSLPGSVAVVSFGFAFLPCSCAVLVMNTVGSCCRARFGSICFSSVAEPVVRKHDLLQLQCIHSSNTAE